MAPLTTLQGRGGGRIPMDGFSYALWRHDLAMLIAQMPDDAWRTVVLAIWSKRRSASLTTSSFRNAAATSQ